MGSLVPVLLLAIAPASLVAQAADGWTGSPNPRIDSLFAAVNSDHSPGCGFEVLRNGQVLYSRGYGMASLEFGIPIRPNTVFDIASLSKHFTGYAILLLERDKKLGLDDDARRFVPELPVSATPVTIRQLLHQTSGLRDYLNLFTWAGVGYEAVVTASDAMALLARQRSNDFPAGTEWEYSNSNYLVLALIVQRAGGKPFPVFMQERVFTPLGMSHTLTIGSHADVVPNRAMPYAAGADGNPVMAWFNWDTIGDGGINTTLGDLARWDEFFYTRSPQDSAMLARMQEPAVLQNGDSAKYGFGLLLGKYRGLRTVSHNGGSSGYYTHLVRFPDQHFSVITACNTVAFVPFGVYQRVADVFLAPEIAAAQSPEPAVVATDADTVASAYTGRYFSEASGQVREIAVRDGATVAIAGGGARRLIALGGGRYRTPARTVVQLARQGGERRLLESPAIGGPPVVYRPIQEAQLSAAALPAYAGRYASAELGVEWTVRVANGSLVLRLPSVNTADDTLHADFRDGFSAGAGPVRFERDAQGKVVALRAWGGAIRGLRFQRVPGGK